MTDAFLSRFDSVPLDSYRRSISAFVRGVLATATIHPGQQEDDPHQGDALRCPSNSGESAFFIRRYDPDVLSEALLNQIPWRELCQDHDRRVHRQRQQDQFQCKKRKFEPSSSVTDVKETMIPPENPFSGGSATPLQTVLELLETDPNTFPWACAKSLAEVLLAQIVFMDECVYGTNGDDTEGLRDPSPGLFHDGVPAPRDSSCRTDMFKWTRDYARRPSYEVLLRVLLRCCERIPAVSLHGLLLEQLSTAMADSEHPVNSTLGEARTRRPWSRRITTVLQLHRIWCLLESSLELSLSIESSSKLFKRARSHDSCCSAVQLKVYVGFVQIADDVEAQLNRQRLTARKESSNIDPEGPRNSHPSDRLGLKRRNPLPLTAQQQVLLWHGEIDPSGAIDSDDEEADDATVRGKCSETKVLEKLRRSHQQPRNDCGGSRKSRLTRCGQCTELGSMRNNVLSLLLAWGTSCTSAQGLQVLNSLLIPALDSSPWSMSLRLLIALHVTSMDRVARRFRRSSNPPIALPPPPRLNALQHLLNEVWEWVLNYLAPDDNLNDHETSSKTSLCIQAPTGRCSVGTGIALLHFYAEMLGELSTFDDPEVLACALQPLVKRILMDVSLADIDDEPDWFASTSSGAAPNRSFDRATATPHSGPAEAQQDGNALAASFRCALAYILSRRGTQAVVKAFSQPIPLVQTTGATSWTLLSLSYSQWPDWYHEAWYEDRVRIRLALRAAGVLSVCDEAIVPCRSQPSEPSRGHGRRYGLRSFASTCSQQSKVFRDWIDHSQHPLFSRDAMVHAAPVASLRSMRQDPSLSPDQHMSGDMIRHVFGFLGYKRLVRMRAVSREWKALADAPDIWRGLYKSRFGPPWGIVSVGTSTAEDDLDWKALFQRKLAAERPLRFRRHSSGWKVRTCRFVGCLKVLTTPGMATRHEKTHVASSGRSGAKRRRPAPGAALSSSRTKRKRK